MAQDLASGESADWVAAVRYARALRSDAATPLVDGTVAAPLRADERPIFQVVATFERRHDTTRLTTWADRSGCQVTGTPQRLVLSHRLKGWVSLWFSEVVGLRIEPGERDWQIEMAFQHQSPVRLTGPGVALVAVHVVAMVHPQTWWRWPH
ncbi:hypothetical protein BJ986_001766 [Phycicoccus badiiscoriae]|uniref:Uncharacterized protein n=1 Tax=Pedococcus badiiscoriae TaxID=642776 RepID=A0A852WES3_9MICO|nr:hypothetical protein [Pedococcus badiiscoriae]NYG07279.1 hypothetical protein [Pedococcus badiiscoriae]